MLDFSFLAVPNIEGMRVLRYIKMLGIVLLFGISLFFCLYLFMQYRRKQNNMHQVTDFEKQTHTLAQQLLLHKITKSSGKTKLVLFIEYLEKFVTTTPYANIHELLSTQGFTHSEIEHLQSTLYTDAKLSKDLETRIDDSLSKF